MAPVGSSSTPFLVTYPDTDNAPRAIGDTTQVPASYPGITVELLQMVGENLQLEIQFKRMPWQRGLYLLERGLVDAIFHASYRPERAKYGVYPLRQGRPDPSRAIYVGRYSIYSRMQDSVEWDGIGLYNVSMPIGVQLGFAAAADLRKLGYAVEEDHSVRANMDKLREGRLSAYVEIETIAESFLKGHPDYRNEIIKHAKPFSEKFYYLLISRAFHDAYPELSERIFDGIRDVQKDPRFQEITNKYQ